MQKDWSHFPFSPARFPFFYGWVMVAGSILAMIASMPGQTMGIGVYTDYLLEAWGLTRSQLSTAYALGTILSGCMLPFAGTFLDRHGLRVMIVVATTGLGGSILMLSRLDLLFPNALPVAAAFSIVTAMFLIVRFFGQGCLAMLSRVIIGKWFNHRRGLATAFMGFFVAFGANSSPMALNHLVESLGWREACLLMALAIGLGVSVLGWLFYRDSPEACGLEMDGGPVAVTKKPTERERLFKTYKEFTRGEALRDPAFWVFSLAIGSQACVITAVTFHMADIGEEMGVSRSEAFAVFLPMAFFSVCANILGGWLSDRVRMKYLLIPFLAGQVVGTIGLLNMAHFWSRMLIYCGYGITGGLFLPLVTITLPRFYGRRELGSISGVNTSVLVLTSALGPTLFSLGHAYFGNYRYIIMLYCALPLLLLAASTFADNPQERFAPQHAGGGPRPPKPPAPLEPPPQDMDPLAEGDDKALRCAGAQR